MAGQFASKEAKLHLATSVGAAIVIVGALFKILHLGGIWGSIMIGVGLGVEAFLFVLGGFFPPHPEVQWDKVYPQLREDGKPTPNDAVAPQAVANTGASQGLDKLLNDASINPELIQSLGNGLRSFGEKVEAIGKVADVSASTINFASKLDTAANNVDSLNGAFVKTAAQIEALGATTEQTKAYHDQVSTLAKNVSALNAVYELELKDSSAHLKTMNSFHENLATTMSNLNDSIGDSKNFKEEVGKLSKNLSSLNAIYGNMLSAMNQSKA